MFQKLPFSSAIQIPYVQRCSSLPGMQQQSETHATAIATYRFKKLLGHKSWFVSDVFKATKYIERCPVHTVWSVFALATERSFKLVSFQVQYLKSAKVYMLIVSSNLVSNCGLVELLED